MMVLFSQCRLFCFTLCVLFSLNLASVGVAQQKSLASEFPLSFVLDSLRRVKPSEIFLRPSAWADAVLSRMTIEEKIGQLFIASCSSVYLPNDNDSFQKVLEWSRSGKIGGVMLMRGDVYSAAMLVNRVQKVAKYPLLVSSDMEWGATMRIDRATEFPMNMGIAATWNPLYAYKAGQIIAREAHAMGIHQNFAPSVDLNNNPSNPIINTRSFGENPELTNAMADAFILGTQKEGVLATAKHFPGHGDTEVDSHKDLPVLPFSKQRLLEVELIPFASAIEKGVMSVMVGHLAVPILTGSEKIPASLSRSVVDSLLRRVMQFQGLIVTDGMRMAGVRKFYSTGEAAVRAIEAGNDMILDSPNIDEAYDAVLYAVQTGRLSEERIRESARRVLVAKEWLRLHEQRFANLEQVSEIVALRGAVQLSEEIASASLTLLKKDKNHIPLKPLYSRARPYAVNISLQNTSSQSTGDGFYASFKSIVSKPLRIKLERRSNSLDYDAAFKDLKTAAAVVVSCYADIRSFEGKYGLNVAQDVFLKKVIAYCKTVKIPLIVISFGTPYLILGYPDIPTYLCAYSSARSVETAAARWMNGELIAEGRLPIRILPRYPFGFRFEESKKN